MLDASKIYCLLVTNISIAATYAALEAYTASISLSLVMRFKPPSVITSLVELYCSSQQTAIILKGLEEYCFDTTRLR